MRVFVRGLRNSHGVMTVFRSTLAKISYGEGVCNFREPDFNITYNIYPPFPRTVTVVATNVNVFSIVRVQVAAM